MANTFKFGNGNWAVKDGSVLAYNDENNNFKPLPFDFTRDSIATRVNRDGLIEVVPNNMPRIDFTDNTSGHLLLEPSRTNLVTYSEDFSNWNTIQATLTSNYGVSPDGSTNSTRCVFSSSNKALEFTLSTSSAIATIYIKGTSGETIQFGTNGSEETFTLNGNWQRLEKYNSSSISRVTLNTYAGATARDIEIWGAQLEQGSYATSYIPTEGSSVQRVAETGVDCLLPNETIVDNSTATVYLEFEALANDASDRWISFEQVGVATDNLFTFRLAAASNLIQIVSRSAGGGQDVVMSETLTDVTANNKIAFNYDGLNWKLAVNGSITDTATAARLFNDNIEKIKFSRYANTNYFYGKVKDLKVYNTALTDTELQNLTS